jgi:hypothetical protein
VPQSFHILDPGMPHDPRGGNGVMTLAPTVPARIPILRALIARLQDFSLALMLPVLVSTIVTVEVRYRGTRGLEMPILDVVCLNEAFSKDEASH